MIKVFIDNEITVNESDPSITWVTKRYIPTKESNGITGLHFHKVTPRIKKTFLKNNEGKC